MELTLALVGLALTVFSLIYAKKTNREKAKMEAILQVRLTNIATNVGKTRANARLAYSHLDTIRRFAQSVNQTEEARTALDHITWLHGDVVATHRMLGVLGEDVVALQKALTVVQSQDGDKGNGTTSFADYDDKKSVPTSPTNTENEQIIAHKTVNQNEENISPVYDTLPTPPPVSEEVVIQAKR